MADENTSRRSPTTHSDPGDAAAAALDDLLVELKICLDGLHEAQSRAEELREQRRGGKSWQDLVLAEERPLIVERISDALESLATAGGRWRKAEAVALHAEGLSINRIAALFGVTRQRISALLKNRDRENAAPDVTVQQQ
jgi:hypothetical protein